MFRREAQVPVDIMYGSSVQEEKINQYIGRVHEELQSSYNAVQNRMSGRLLWEKELYDKEVHGEEYRKDSLVWFHSAVVTKGKSKKLHRPWSESFCVIKQLSEVTYRCKISEIGEEKWWYTSMDSNPSSPLQTRGTINRDINKASTSGQWLSPPSVITWSLWKMTIYPNHIRAPIPNNHKLQDAHDGPELCLNDSPLQWNTDICLP